MNTLCESSKCLIYALHVVRLWVNASTALPAMTATGGSLECVGQVILFSLFANSPLPSSIYILGANRLGGETTGGGEKRLGGKRPGGKRLGGETTRGEMVWGGETSRILKIVGRNGYGSKWYGPKWSWADLVMGRFGYGPK